MRAEPTKTTRWVTPTQEQRGAMRRAERIERAEVAVKATRGAWMGMLGWVMTVLSWPGRAARWLARRAKGARR